jgi:hypothetical protein
MSVPWLVCVLYVLFDESSGAFASDYWFKIKSIAFGSG